MEGATQTLLAEFVIGTKVVCNEEEVGYLRRVVIDPIAHEITHLVVQPQHHRGLGHLVPVDLTVSASETKIELHCTTSAFTALEAAEEVHFYPGGSGVGNYQQSQMLTSPFYPMWMAMGSPSTDNHHPKTITDRVPTGEVRVRKGARVAATDGPIGHVQGLVVDPSDHCVTHVLLDDGHLWGKKRVAIPIGAVKGVSDGVHLTLSKQDVENLPAVNLNRPRKDSDQIYEER